jgi:nitrogen-specific signal transduction histidine kinase
MKSDKQALSSRELETLGKLAPAIAHDINNLLSGIIGYSQIIMSDPSAGMLKSYAEEIETASKRISGLTRLLQVFNQGQSFHEELLDLNGILQELEKYIPKILGEDIHYSIEKAPKLFPIRADKSRIRQSLLLWFGKFRELLPQGGRVVLKTENIASIPESLDFQADNKHAIRIRAEIMGNIVTTSSTTCLSTEEDGLNDAKQKAKSVDSSLAEIMQLCSGHTLTVLSNETALSIHVFFAAETSLAD